jgi:putative FmdB family regulatory protein
VPTYEYRCPKGHTFEMFQRMSDPPAESCEVCGEAPVEKILFPVAVHFKGSGFYNTDYGKSRKAASDSDGSGGSGGSSDKTESSDSGASDKKGGSSDTGSASGSSGTTSSSSD